MWKLIHCSHSIRFHLLVCLTVMTVYGETLESCATTGMASPAQKVETSKWSGKRSNVPTHLSLRVRRISPKTLLEKRRVLPQALPPTDRYKVAVKQMSDLKKNTQVTGANTYEGNTYPSEYEYLNPVPLYITPGDFEVHKKRLFILEMRCIEHLLPWKMKEKIFGWTSYPRFARLQMKHFQKN